MPLLPPDARREAVVRELHAAGRDDEEIAAALDVARSTAARWRARMGLRANPTPGQRAGRDRGVIADVLRLKGEGLSQDAIGRRLGLTKGQVAGILARAGACKPTGKKRPAKPREHRADTEAAPAPGWPQMRRCLGPCGRMRLTHRKEERMCGCHKGTRLYDQFEHALAGARMR